MNTPEAFDKRLELLKQAVDLGFKRTEELVMGLSKQIDGICANITTIESRLDSRITRLEDRADAHDRALDRYDPWINGMQKVIWIVVGVMTVAAVSGIAWAVMQSGALP